MDQWKKLVDKYSQKLREYKTKKVENDEREVEPAETASANEPSLEFQIRTKLLNLMKVAMKNKD